MNALLMNITRFVKDEEGVTAVEYGLIAALIALVIAVSVALVGTNLNTLFSKIAKCVGTPNSANCT